MHIQNELDSLKLEELVFKKDMHILRNDYYYKYCGEIFSDESCMIDLYHSAHEKLFGSLYSIRKIAPFVTFYLVLDAKEKTLSASFTAMALTSFINYFIDKSIVSSSMLDLRELLDAVLLFAKPLLLEEETLGAHFILSENDSLEYASFAMPSILIADATNTLQKLASNNSEIDKHKSSFTIDKISAHEIKKILIYNDGLAQNRIKDSVHIYAKYIDEDFTNSFSIDDFEYKIQSRIDTQTDALTCIFINKMDFEKKLLDSKTINTCMNAVEEAHAWHEDVVGKIMEDADAIEKCNYPFRELLLNAFEHGNLGISNSAKHQAIESGDYWDMIDELVKYCDKSIEISIYQANHLDESYILTTIKDEGEGFDTTILKNILSKKQYFNGRGVFISKKFSNGIYYNSIGNSILIINKINQKKRK